MLAIALSTLSAFAGEENVNAKVLNAFKSEFKTATDVTWVSGANYYEAKFVYNDKYLFAYYSTEGELLGLTRYIKPENLPISLQKSLKNKYRDYWISDLFEVAKNDGTSYYITLENADSQLVLKSTDSYNWNFYKRVKKS